MFTRPFAPLKTFSECSRKRWVAHSAQYPKTRDKYQQKSLTGFRRLHVGVGCDATLAIDATSKLLDLKPGMS